jgi:hypothetical protein
MPPCPPVTDIELKQLWPETVPGGLAMVTWHCGNERSGEKRPRPISFIFLRWGKASEPHVQEGLFADHEVGIGGGGVMHGSRRASVGSLCCSGRNART